MFVAGAVVLALGACARPAVHVRGAAPAGRPSASASSAPLRQPTDELALLRRQLRIARAERDAAREQLRLALGREAELEARLAQPIGLRPQPSRTSAGTQPEVFRTLTTAKQP